MTSQPVKNFSLNQFEVSYDDGSYPEWFTELAYKPDALYIQGPCPRMLRGVGVIGSCEATPYGEKAAYKVAQWVVECGLPVYSGCARGCDQAAHRGALDGGGVTAAVMGCGADVVYPASARALLERIGSSGGTVSLFPWGALPQRYTFVLRNKLIVALSYFIVIVEGTVNSGTNSAVSHAQELGVDVYAVPGSIFSKQSGAPNQLISDGCNAITSKDDVMCAIELAGVTCRPCESGQNRLVGLSTTERLVLRQLAAGPLTCSDIMVRLQQSCKIDVSILGALELRGIIYKDMDGRYYPS